MQKDLCSKFFLLKIFRVIPKKVEHFRFALKFSATMHEWSEIYMIAFRVSAVCRIWFAQEILYKHPGRFMEYFFDSPTADVRKMVVLNFRTIL